MTEYTVEVPNTNVKETVFGMDEAEPICYDMAQEYGIAEVVFYAPVSYTHLTLPTILLV